MTITAFINSLEEAKKLVINKQMSITIGNFDGVHIGHKNLITNTINSAKNNNYYSAAIIFNVHPQVFFNKIANYEIFDLETKINTLKQFNLDYIFVINFANFSQLSGISFFNNFLLNILKIKQLNIGKDFKFGSDKLNADALQTIANKNNVIINIVDYTYAENTLEKVSSSNIRKYLQEGKIEQANILLGKPFSTTVSVIQGKQLGRTIGLHTANSIMQNNTLLHKGVYATKVLFNNNVYFSISNFGYRPTVDNSNNYFLETHLFNFNQNLYYHLIEVQFFKFIRDEHKFASLEDLKLQIQSDIIQVKEFFNINN